MPYADLISVSSKSIRFQSNKKRSAMNGAGWEHIGIPITCLKVEFPMLK